MPTSDGHFTTRDLCTSVVDTRVIAAAAVTQEKIANLAVGTAQIDDLAVDTAQINTAAVTKLKVGDQEIDVQRMLDPVHVDTIYKIGTAQTIPVTANTVSVSDTYTVPTWVGDFHVLAIGHVYDTWGTTQTIAHWLDIGGTDGTHVLDSVVSGEYTVLTNSFSRSITSPGATVTVEIEASAATTAETNCYVWFNTTATGLR